MRRVAQKPDLFVGVTSWNSEKFLEHCLRSILNTTPDIDRRLVVLDNGSTDRSIELARDIGAEVLVAPCSQSVAMSRLASLSNARYTLLIHADVVLLSDHWFALCREKLNRNVALVSPEDIGCGPYSRPFGMAKPESSFLFFDTLAMRQIRTVLWRRRWYIPVPHWTVDFYGPHVTHRLPKRLRSKGYTWQPMQVHISDRLEMPIYEPAFKPGIWTEELGYLRYGLGNFYSLSGEITHYHNWYDRVPYDVPEDSTRTTGRNGEGFPLAYIKSYTDNFLQDYLQGRLVIPPAVRSSRPPVAL